MHRQLCADVDAVAELVFDPHADGQVQPAERPALACSHGATQPNEQVGRKALRIEVGELVAVGKEVELELPAKIHHVARESGLHTAGEGVLEASRATRDPCPRQAALEGNAEVGVVAKDQPQRRVHALERCTLIHIPHVKRSAAHAADLVFVFLRKGRHADDGEDEPRRKVSKESC